MKTKGIYLNFLSERRHMKLKNIKDIIVCDLVIAILFLAFAIAIGLQYTNVAQFFTVLVYIPSLFLYPLVICPWLGVRLRNAGKAATIKGFILSAVVFCLAFLLFCIPIIPLYTQYDFLQIGLVTLLPAIISATAFFVKGFTHKKSCILLELKDFFIYAFITALLIIPNHIYAFLDNDNLLVLFWMILYYPILFLSALLICPIFGRHIHNQYPTLSPKRKWALTASVFLTLLLVFSVAVQPSVFSRLLWEDYRTNFYLCALAPAGIGAAGFALTIGFR